MKKGCLISFIILFVSLAYGQNKSTVLLSTDFNESFPPSGWTIDSHTSNWHKATSAKAGGSAPECVFSWDPSFNSDSRLISPEIDLTGKTNVFLAFKHSINNYSNGYTVGVATRSGGGAWTTVWSHGPSDVTEDVLINISNSDVGQSDFQFCMYFSGNSYNINYWYFDDIVLEVPEANDMKMISINSPVYTSEGSLDISATIQNFGLSTINTVDVSYQIDLEPVVSQSLTGLTINPADAHDFTFTTPWDAVSGVHSLKVWLSNVNGGGDDDYTNNDTIVRNQYIATQTTTNFPLFEEFTSSTCGPCASFNSNTFTPFLNSHGTECAVIKYQMSWPNPGDPYYTDEGGVRRAYYGVSGVPSLFTGGVSTATTSTGVNSAFATQQAKTTFFEISGTHQISGTNISVQAKITPYVTTANNDFTVHIVVVEKVTTQNTGNNGETEFHYVMMKMLPDASGTPINFESGTQFTINETVDMSSTHVEEMDDLDVIIFIQNNVTQEVFQSTKSTEGVSIENNENHISVYPNPANNSLSLLNVKNATFEIYDILGKLVISSSVILNNKKINVSYLKEGTYFIKINNGDFIKTEKFTISR